MGIKIHAIKLAASDPSVAQLTTESYGEVFCQVWALSKARKVTKCCRCWEPIAVGEKVYRPMTNLNNRSNRLHPKCLLKAAELLKGRE